MKKKKGFTLVELMIVIVIIGILAAIIIPTVSNAIDKANFANDETDARNMTQILLMYCAENGISAKDLEAPEVRAIVSSGQKNYTFVPKSNNAHFWFDIANEQVIVQTSTDYNVSSLGNAAYAADVPANPTSPENIRTGYLYLNTTGSLAALLSRIRNLTSVGDYEQLKNMKVEGIDLTNFINVFSPENTLYISSSGMVAEHFKEISNIVFAEGLVTISETVSGASRITIKDGVRIRIPSTVKLVEEKSFLYITSNTPVVLANPSTKVVKGALSDSIKAVTDVENISVEDAYKETTKGNALVSIEVYSDASSTNDTSKLVDTVRCTDTSNAAKAVGGIVGRIELFTRYTIGGVSRYSIKDATETADSTEANVKLGIGQIKINTKALMAAYKGIDSIDVKYVQKDKDFVDIYIKAFDDNGMVVYLIVTYCAA